MQLPRYTAQMIENTPNLLVLDADCHIVACRFDVDAFLEDQAEQLGIVLPEKLQNAIPKRRAEFLAGRYCAQLALKAIGYNGVPEIRTTRQRAPRWPRGSVGAITHSKGYAAAAVAERNKIRSLGIDSEQLITAKTTVNTFEHILLPEEQNIAENTDTHQLQRHLTLIFSIKESIFKALYPLTGQFFSFKDACVSITSENSTNGGNFSFELRKDLRKEFKVGYQGHGKFIWQGDFVHTGVVVKNDFSKT